MKLIRFVMFLIYNYYKKGKYENAPYFHMLCSISFLAIINIGTFFCFLREGHLLFDGSRGFFILKFLISFLFFIISFNLIGKKKLIEGLNFSFEKIQKGQTFLLVYIVLSIVLLFIGIITSP